MDCKYMDSCGGSHVPWHDSRISAPRKCLSAAVHARANLDKS